MKPQKRSSKCEVVNLSISFNLLDPHQKKLYDHAKKFVNFSAAGKRWLESEMNKGEGKVIDLQQYSPKHHHTTQLTLNTATDITIDTEETEFDPITSLL